MSTILDKFYTMEYAARMCGYPPRPAPTPTMFHPDHPNGQLPGENYVEDVRNVECEHCGYNWLADVLLYDDGEVSFKEVCPRCGVDP